MKFFNVASILAIALLVNDSSAHKLSTLPDVRAATVKKNPQSHLLASIKTDLDQISKDLSFGISFSQTKRNDHARELATKVSGSIQDYCSNLLTTTEAGPEETLTEQNAANIASVIFYDVQLQDAMKGLGMPE